MSNSQLTAHSKNKIMKKTLLLALALLISTSIFAQKRSVLLRETFDALSAPLGWTTSENAADNWAISTTNKAGGEANELKFNSTPQAVGVSRIITTPVDLTGLSTVTVSFRHFFDKKTMSALIGIATSSNNGQTWSAAWSQSYSEGGQYTVIKSVKTPDMGKNNVLFCIYFQGNSSSVNGWYFDDLEITTLEAIDAKAESIDMGNIVPAGDNEIVFSVQNTGSDAITSFEASFEMNGETITESFETQLAQYETKQFSFEKKINLTPNNYNSKLEITSVNGEQDQNNVNNIARKNICVALNKTQRLPMIEHFSSSTCSACVSLDGAMKELTAANTGRFVYTKYAMNWPGSGDPYYTSEGNVKKNLYNVGSVPFLAFNGKSHSYIAITQEELDATYDSPAFIDIKGAFNTEGSNINIVADIMPYVNLSNVKVHISVNEKITTENIGTNGLKEFHHIMMKMFPNAEGSATDFVAGEAQRFEFTYDMSKTFVEEMNDLEVAVWIQDIDTKEIYNSNYLYEYTEHPYSVQNLKLADTDNTLLITWEAPQQSNPVGYNIYINDSLIAENHKELSYSTKEANGLTFVKVAAVYENGKTSVGVIDNIVVELNTESISENTISLNIYPNPVNDKLYIVTEDEVEDVVVYDIYGRRQQLSAISHQPSVIDVADLKSGIYFIKINTNEGNIVKRIIKN